MKTWSDLADSRWKDRARLELAAQANGGRVEYRCHSDGQWETIVVIPADPETWIVTSGPRASVEAGCAEVLRRFDLAGQRIPDGS